MVKICKILDRFRPVTPGPNPFWNRTPGDYLSLSIQEPIPIHTPYWMQNPNTVTDLGKTEVCHGFPRKLPAVGTNSGNLSTSTVTILTNSHICPPMITNTVHPKYIVSSQLRSCHAPLLRVRLQKLIL
ncbi:hypothetical protein AVEN_184463-1 [Araneus ventricosus]|uniref:Uncharacterized protein n=1 Tax=Araneus ventricosus TaxID=182803 RepID=A0A4Y2BI73_ARAVE|nr:hypothetical protein AVEN_184463-1 [Araneus ventricosus]